MSAVVRYSRATQPRTITSTLDPTTGDDAADGYRVGDIWVNTTTKVAFELVDATAGAAVWKPITEDASPSYLTGNYYGQSFTGAQTTQIMVENTMYFVPIYIRSPVSADRIGMYVFTGAGDVENQTRWGVYLTTNNAPGARLLDAGFVTNGTGTGMKVATISQALPAGLIWLAGISNRNAGATGTMPTPIAVSAGLDPNRSRWGSADLNTAPGMQFSAAITPGTWASYTMPDPAPAVTIASANAPRFGFRAA